MILQALVQLYEALAGQKKVAVEGWDKAKVSHRILLSEAGDIEGIISAKVRVTRGKKGMEIPAEMWVPLPVVRSSGVKANFLCDNASYFLGIDDKGKPERTKECFQAAKELHHLILDSCQSVSARAVLHFFDRWDIDKAKENPFISQNIEDIFGASNFIFQVNGIDVQEDSEIREAWRQHCECGDESAGENSLGLCLVIGKENQKIAITHSKIKGVLGAQSSGANLVAFNAASFCSYGYDGEQGKNAPIGEYAALAYVKALNYLLSDTKHREILGDTTVVYWSKHAETEYQDCMSAMLDDNTLIDAATLDQIMKNMKEGKPSSLQGLEISPEEPFYILGLAPNAARISVRFFLENTFGETMKNLMAHQERMRIVHAPFEKDFIKIWMVLKEITNPHGNDSASPILSGSFLRAVLTDGNYPAAVFQSMMMRIHADQDQEGDKTKKKINYVKSAFIKAYLLQNGQKKWRDIIQMAVNKETKEISYVLGRLFSVLENIQENANPGINATIKDRYFNAACATPAVTFPVLFKLSNAHLRKREMDGGKAVYFSKKIQELMDKITMPDVGHPFPKRLTLEEQGAFVLGYYQETQARYTTKKEEVGNE